MKSIHAALAVISLFWFGAVAQAADAPLELQKGDHICIVGNGLAERMQHYGFLETLLHAQFPEHELVIRNLGYSGDEIDGWKNPNHRMRSMSFGSHDEWLSGNAPVPQPGKLSSRDKDDPKRVRENRFELANTKADVVFAFYGYSESWAGEAGLAAFKQNVEEFIKHTLAQKYNGKSAPKLVLFSPIAHEFIPSDPNLPSKAEVDASNARLKMYSEAMGEVAKANGALFVDLFTPTLSAKVFYYDDDLEGVLVKVPNGTVKRTGLGKTLTTNGVHINKLGDEIVARVANILLFAWKRGVGDNHERRLLIQPAVLDKNFYWFNRYRVTDGFSTYGDRAFLKFSEGPGGYGDGLSNYSVGQRELDVLDVMTSNRDKAVWAAAQGKTIKPDDSNIPEFIPVTSNKPGELPGGKHKFLSGQEAIGKMTVGKGLKVELFADEAMFPELVNPVQMEFDTKGRLWVAAWRTYPHWKPTEPMNDKLLILEDTNGDGRADVCKTFAGDLHNPTGFEFWNGGVFVAQGPDVLFLKDTNGDDKYDVKERVMHGVDTADTHHTINSFTLDPGGALYMQEGTFHHSQIETPWGPPRRVANGAVLRYEPRQQKTDIYVTYGFANPHGHVFDKWGQDIVVDGTGAVPYHGPLFSSHLDYPHKHGGTPTVYKQRTRPCSAIEILSSSHFPEEFRDNLLVLNVIGFQGILRYKLHGSNGDVGAADPGSSLGATELEPILSSSDPNFRPADVEVGPDGAIYFTDWQNPIIGHMQHNLRDPSRDQEHGRVYRVTYDGRKLEQPKPLAGQPIEALLKLLKDPDDRVRHRARIELSARPTAELSKPLARWQVDQFLAVTSANMKAATPTLEVGQKPAIEPGAEAPSVADAAHTQLEALWLHQSHNIIHVGLLELVLESPDYRARAAAVRVLATWRDDLLGLPGNLPSGASVTDARDKSQQRAIELLLRAAADESSRVRLMAIWAASFIPKAEAYEVLLVAREQAMDPPLTHLANEVARTLQPLYDEAKKAGRDVVFKTDAGRRHILKQLSNEDLLKQPRDRAVLVELLYRSGLRDEQRRAAVSDLAKLEKVSELQVLIAAINALDGGRGIGFQPVNNEGEKTTGKMPIPLQVDPSVIFDLVRQLTNRTATELTAARAELEKLATTAKQPIFRQIGYVSLINVDGQVDAAWKLANAEPRRVIDFANALPLVSDASVRATLYERLLPLLKRDPMSKSKGTQGRFVRIELPGKGTLTLAEVEVYADGVNVARRGKASQKNTGYGGDASRAIDGNKSGSYGDNGQTHTDENTDNPFWEVDLGDEQPIEQIIVFNRTDGDLGNRLGNFTLKVLDGQRAEVFKQERLPAPQPKSQFAIEGGGTGALVRRAVMQALTTVRGQELKTFETLKPFVIENDDRIAAIRALQRLPRTTWPKEDAPQLVAVLLESIKKAPADQRTLPALLDQFEFADVLSSLLPPDQAKLTRKQLGELGVRVIKLGTVFEKMSFDKEIVAVQAGKPVEFVLENSDLMPHNFVILQPGSLEEVGLQAEANAQQPAFAAAGFVPSSPKVLAKSALLQPRDTQKLSVNVPTQPGVYPFVCTYPGHWRRMFGALYVVADLDEYLANPDGYLASVKLQPVDPLLKNNRPRTEWKFEDFAQAVEALDHAAMGHGDHGSHGEHGKRSFGNGKQLFTVANCIACHKVGDVGKEFGPDLTKLDAKLKPSDILKDILDPSLRLNEKFQSNIIELQDGKVVQGIVIEETGDIIKLVENPLIKPEPILIKRNDVAARVRSKVSIMPKGLLDKLTREELLDLVSFIASRNNKDAAIFKGGH